MKQRGRAVPASGSAARSAKSGPGLIADVRRMWGLLELSRWRVAVAVGWGVLALGSGLGLAALAAWLIARAWQMPPVLDLTVAVVTVRALGISRGLCRYLERLATHDVALRSMTTARAGVYRALSRSDVWMRRERTSGGESPAVGPVGERGSGAEPTTAAARRPAFGKALPANGFRGDEPAADSPARMRRGDLLVRIGSDIDDLGAVVVRALVPIAVAVVLAIAAVVLLATISVAAAGILAACLVLSGVLAPWLSARAAREAEIAVRADRAEFTARSLTVLDHAAELRVAGRLDAALAAARDSGRRAVAAEDRAARHGAWAAAATPFAIGVSVLGALLIGLAIYGPTGGLPGGMTPMALTILVLLPLSAFEAVGPLPAAAQAITTARAALRRLDAAETPDARRVSPPDLPDLPAGRRIAVVGPSGAGKTTLLMAWAGLFDTPRPGVTFFAEDAHLFGTSVLENLRVARGDITDAEAEEALRKVGLGDWLDSLPEGVHTDLVGGAAAVSGGQRRRILLARALLAPARVLLLDEPTEHLEAEAGADLLRALLDPSGGLVEPDRTVVVVTHQPPAGHRADAVVHVDASGQVSTEFATEKPAAFA
ncbi:ATP-binding cassette domain-containing protein [Nocardia puris]|nr:ATP-binding cassette domain-containing protein [Nocardia puris]MBF6365792.1 ATP-binding cassette domain-containing protein [Nocardia puris]MBF6460565.1 ATP-binding cassette domain-containing protein [Nocardia puris]